MTRPLSHFYSMHMAVVDLSAGTAEVLPVPEDLIRNSMGGASANLDLLDQYRKEDPLVLGVGPLTGTFAPASALMAATFISPKTKRPTHTPVLRSAGADLKFSGLSFVVIKGRSPGPQALFISQGRTRLFPADDLTGLQTTAAWKALRRKIPDFSGSILLTGCVADQKSPLAALSVDLGGGWDKNGMALWMQARNLKAILLSGTGRLPVSEDQMAHARVLRGRMDARLPSGERVCLAVLRKIDPTFNPGALRPNMMRKDLACYHCPFPCISFVGADREKGKGFVLFDHMGFLALTRKSGSLAPGLMRLCLDLGLDPAAAATCLSGDETMEQASEVLLKLVSGEDSLRRQARVHAEPSKGYEQVFGGGIPAVPTDSGEQGSEGWAKRVAAAMILGICPLVMLLFSVIDEKMWIRFLCDQQEGVLSLQKRLELTIDKVVSRENPGTLH
ncbi:MAG: hypothetical protein JXL84_20925 [Deltaproteobacteria bacterium]|nr:hypothetical protein [Deltaproteobacteria bacterium]